MFSIIKNSRIIQHARLYDYDEMFLTISLILPIIIHHIINEKLYQLIYQASSLLPSLPTSHEFLRANKMSPVT